MEIKKLIDIAFLLNGYAFKSAKYVDSGIRVIRIANVQDGYIADDSPCFYPFGLDDEISNYYLSENDILISLTGNVGRVGRMPKQLLPAALNQRVSCIRIKNSNIVNKDYLFYYLRRKEFLKDCIDASKGVAQLNLSSKWLENYIIPIPSLSEQERIVARIEEMFSQLDSGVETLKKIKAQLAVYRQAVLKEAFSSYLDKTVEISKLVDDIRIGPFGTMLHKSDYISNGTPVVNPQHIKNGKIIPNLNVTISNEKAKELSAYKLKTNDIIMGRRGEMGRTAAITGLENGWICGTGSILFRLKPEYDAVFYSQLLSSPDVVHYLEEHATGTTMKNLNEDIVKHIPVPQITIEMQKIITMNMENKRTICDSIEQTVDSALQQTEAMRQSILKQAFEGNL